MPRRPLSTESSPTDSPDLLTDVFHGLPSGILVIDRRKRLLAANQAANQLLDVRMPLAAAGCCGIFGCGEPGTPLENACLTELAVGAGGALPEVRIDLPDESRTGALWVTASPLGRDGSYIVVQIRQGERGDRRRRTEPHWVGERRLSIDVLGRMNVKSAEGSIGGSWLDQRPGQLLKYLVTQRDRAVPVEQIAATLWPGSGVEALNTVRHYIHVLREKLEPGRPKRSESSFVAATPSGYRIDPVRVEIDAELFEQRVRTGVAAYVAGEEGTAACSLQEALTLYRGDFLSDDPYAEWALSERDRLRTLAGRACRTLVEYCGHIDDLETAAEYGGRLAELEPFDIEVARAVLSIALRRGRRSEAVRRYGTMRQRMLREFGEDLPFDLAQLSRDLDQALKLT